jgi:hypothetical protein
VRQGLKRAREQLRQRLGARYGDRPARSGALLALAGVSHRPGAPLGALLAVKKAALGAAAAALPLRLTEAAETTPVTWSCARARPGRAGRALIAGRGRRTRRAPRKPTSLSESGAAG